MAHLITGLIFIPLLGALFVSVAPRNYARAVALGSMAITALLALTVWRHFDPTAVGLQMVGRHRWIPAIGAEVLLGIDGLSLLLVLLTSLVFPFALLAQRMGRGFCALMLVMQAALYGTFTAQNFILWFLFYEMSLIPGVPAHQSLGWRESRPRRDEIFPLHLSRERRDAALVSRHLFR